MCNMISPKKNALVCLFVCSFVVLARLFGFSCIKVNSMQLQPQQQQQQGYNNNNDCHNNNNNNHVYVTFI